MTTGLRDAIDSIRFRIEAEVINDNGSFSGIVSSLNPASATDAGILLRFAIANAMLIGSGEENRDGKPRFSIEFSAVYSEPFKQFRSHMDYIVDDIAKASSDYPKIIRYCNQRMIDRITKWEAEEKPHHKSSVEIVNVEA